MYGRIENGHLTAFTDRIIHIDGATIINPSEKYLSTLGYKPILDIAAPRPAEGETLVVGYVDEGQHIRPTYKIIGGLK